VVRIGEANAPVSVISKKQKLVTRSTMESELVAVDTVAQEAIWIRNILAEFGHPQKEPTVLEQDNKSCILMANRGPGTGKSRFIDIRFFWITEKIEDGIIKMKYVASEELIADGLTKPLTKSKFIEWKKKILNHD